MLSTQSPIDVWQTHRAGNSGSRWYRRWTRRLADVDVFWLTGKVIRRRYIPGVAVKVETSAEDSKVRIQSGSLAIQLQEHDRCRGGGWGCKSHVWELSETGLQLIHHLRRPSGQRGFSTLGKWTTTPPRSSYLVGSILYETWVKYNLLQ